MKCTGILFMIVTVLFLLGMSQTNVTYDAKINLDSISTAPQRTGELEDTVHTELEHHIVRYDSASLDSNIRASMASWHIPGAATWCSKNGQVIWQQGYGYANIEDSIPVADTTLFVLASVSKTFTATAIMQLWERGVFELDDDINDYLPFNVRNPSYPDSIITFRMLMTHTSSIRDNFSVLNYGITWGGDSPIRLGSFLWNYFVPGGIYYDSALNFSAYSPPGNVYQYCNVAVALLGYLVEAIEGDFPIHCQDSIFYPLGMDETSWFLAGLNMNNIAIPYAWTGSYYFPYQHLGFAFYPCATLRTSTLQLARHLVAFMQYGIVDSVRILDSTTVELMRTVQYTISQDSKIGLIWFYEQIYGRWLWWHDGSMAGCRTAAGFCPAESSAVIVLTNGESSGGMRVIMEALYNYAEQYGIEEQTVNKPIATGKNLIATIFRGPLQLPEGKQYRVFDITGRVVEPASLTRGIYFIEIEGEVIQKVIRVR